MDEDNVMDNGDDGSEHSEENMSAMDEGEDDGEWKGIGANAETLPDEHFTGKKSNKPPTGEELRAIKDASDLFKSGSFKLQVCCLVVFGLKESFLTVSLLGGRSAT